ncbi:MAG: YbjN domain-containing protein [Gaiellaceae bacterium]
MVETTFDIRFSAGEACVILGSNAAGDVGKQAELVCFGHYAARTLALLGPERALPLLHTLSGLEEASSEHLEALVESESAGLEAIGGPDVRVVHADRSFQGDAAFHVLVRFLNARGGPRIFFSVKPKGAAASHRRPRYEAAAVQLLLLSLLQQRAADTEYVRRLATTASLIGRLAADGGILRGNEFDASLVSADVAWGSDPAAVAGDGGEAELQCPVCGNQGSSDAFEPRLWPSQRAAIRKCRRCGTGLWARARRRVRILPPGVWGTMETMRDDLLLQRSRVTQTAAHDDGAEAAGESALLGELKRVFVENGWPFSEVRGAEVLVSDLSGPLGRWKFYAQVVAEQDLILLYSVCPLRVPAERRSEVSQFLTCANYGLAAGNFELDFEDGEIRYKTVLHIQGDGLDRTIVKRLVRSNGMAMETYLPGIGAVITGTAALPALERRTPD